MLFYFLADNVHHVMVATAAGATADIIRIHDAVYIYLLNRYGSLIRCRTLVQGSMIIICICTIIIIVIIIIIIIAVIDFNVPLKR